MWCSFALTVNISFKGKLKLADAEHVTITLREKTAWLTGSYVSSSFPHILFKLELLLSPAHSQYRRLQFTDCIGNVKMNQMRPVAKQPQRQCVFSKLVFLCMTYWCNTMWLNLCSLCVMYWCNTKWPGSLVAHIWQTMTHENVTCFVHLDVSLSMSYTSRITNFLVWQGAARSCEGKGYCYSFCIPEYLFRLCNIVSLVVLVKASY